METENKYYDCEFYTKRFPNTSIKFNYLPDNKGVTILNSYEIKDDIHKILFINNAMIELGVDFGKRNNMDLLVEWKAHNILYNKKLFVKRTKDTTLDANEKWYRRIFYKIICFFFTEK